MVRASGLGRNLDTIAHDEHGYKNREKSVVRQADTLSKARDQGAHNEDTAHGNNAIKPK